MRNIWILFLSVIGFLVIFELALEVTDSTKGNTTLLLHHKNKSEDTLWGNTSDSAFPFRSLLKPLKDCLQPTKIWILSSSMTEDIYIPPEQTWPALCEHILSEHGCFRMMNAARIGMDLLDGLEKLQRYYHQYTPDIVIVYEMSNTITQMSNNNKHKNNSLTNNINIPHWSSLFAEHTSLYSKTKNQIGLRIIEARILSDSLDTALQHQFIAYLEELRIFCDEHGIKLFICSFPTSVTTQDDNRSVEKAVRFCYKSNLLLSTFGWVHTIESWNDALRCYTKQKNIALIELDHTLSGSKGYFRDYVHLTPVGHDSVAHIVAASLKK